MLRQTAPLQAILTLTMMILMVHIALTAVVFASKDTDDGMNDLVSNKKISHRNL